MQTPAVGTGLDSILRNSSLLMGAKVVSSAVGMAVMVLLCGDEGKHVGAIELWHNDPELSHEISLVDGYYGTAETFEFNSRHTRFSRGYGLPGRAWKAGMPVIMNDLDTSGRFLRRQEASEVGIRCGVLYGFATNSPFSQMGLAFELKAFAVMIVGGMGSIPGAVLGAYLLSFGEIASLAFLPSELRDAFAFGLLFIVLLVRPRGILGQRAVDRV